MFLHHVILVRDSAQDLSVTDLAVPQLMVEPVDVEVVRGLERLLAQVASLVPFFAAVNGPNVPVHRSLVLLEVGAVGAREELLARVDQQHVSPLLSRGLE